MHGFNANKINVGYLDKRQYVHVRICRPSGDRLNDALTSLKLFWYSILDIGRKKYSSSRSYHFLLNFDPGQLFTQNNCEKCQFFGGYPWGGGDGGKLCEISWQTSTLAMWLVNMNCLGIVGKKLAREGRIIVKNVKKVNFLWGLPMGRGWWGGLCEIFLTNLNPGYVVVNMNCLGIVGKKLVRVNGKIIVKNVIFFVGATHGERVMGEGCVKFSRQSDLDPGYVVGEYELSKYSG